MDSEHWNDLYDRKGAGGLGWYEDDPALSRALITAYADPEAAVLDAGGGASSLTARLFQDGFTDLTVLDLSASALSAAQAQMGPDAGQVEWILSDVTRWEPHKSFDLWHDRAVFHFLTTAQARAAYVETLRAALRSGGTAIIATFAQDGPESCAGLPVQRYSPKALADELDRLAPGRFTPLESRSHAHLTPAGAVQRYQVSVFRLS